MEGANNKNNEAYSNLLEDRNKNKCSKGPTFGKRHIQAIMLSCLAFMAFNVRTVLTVNIVAMTNPTTNPNKDIPTYNWSDKSLVMASFLWGYFIPQCLAGYVGDRYGAKWFLVVTTSITAIAGLLVPTAAAVLGSKGVMICRFLQGLSQGFLFPSIASLLGKWIPSNERSRIGTAVYSGSPLGIISSMMLTGYIATSRYGWPMAFYLYSTLTLITVAIFAYVGCNDPSLHSTITDEEKNYIKSNLNTHEDRSQIITPFKEILTSLPFYALMITSMAYNFTHWTMISETAIYLDKYMKFDLKSNSLLSALPYICEFVVGFVACFIADYMITRKIVSITITRKIMNNIGIIIPAIALYILGNTTRDEANTAVFLMVLVIGMHGTAKSGHTVNHMDLAPNFSGVLMGIANGCSVLLASFAPLIAQIVLKDETDQNQWKIVFYVALGVNVIAAIVNTLFTTGKEQEWNQGSGRKNGTVDQIKPVIL